MSLGELDQFWHFRLMIADFSTSPKKLPLSYQKIQRKGAKDAELRKVF